MKRFLVGFILLIGLVSFTGNSTPADLTKNSPTTAVINIDYTAPVAIFSVATDFIAYGAVLNSPTQELEVPFMDYSHTDNYPAPKQLTSNHKRSITQPPTGYCRQI